MPISGSNHHEPERLGAVRNLDPDSRSNLMNALVLATFGFGVGLMGLAGVKEVSAGGNPDGDKEVVMGVIANDVDKGLAGKELEKIAEKIGEKYGIEVKLVYHKPSETDKLLREERYSIILGGPDAYDGVGDVVKEFLSEKEVEEVRKHGSVMVFEKTNPYNGGIVYIFAGSEREGTRKSIGANHDGDLFLNGEEALLWNHPLKKSYGLEELADKLDFVSLRSLGGIDEDGKLDENEKTFVEFVKNVADGKWIDGKYRKWFWSKEELREYAGRVVKGMMEDGKVSKEEAEGMRYAMNNFRWKDGRGGIVFDLIDGNALSDKNLGRDFDGDGYSNMDEIKEGFNPFNKWEYPGNEDGYTRVFYVGVNGTVFRYDPLAPFFIPMMMLKYGLKPEDMKILVQEWKDGKFGKLSDWKDTKPFPDWGWFAGKNVYKVFKDVGGELYGLDETTTPERFLQAIEETVKQMDGNDVLIVFYNGHGPDPSIYNPDTRELVHFSWKDVAKIIESGKGYKIMIIHSCYAENAIRDNFDPASAYFIGTSKLNEEIGGGEQPIIISTRMAEGYRVKEWYNKANVCQDGSCEIGEINPVKWVKKP